MYLGNNILQYYPLTRMLRSEKSPPCLFFPHSKWMKKQFVFIENLTLQ